MRDYRNKIDFLYKDKKYNDYGEPIDDWKVFKDNIWASKEPLLGKEFFNALTTSNKVEVKFNMRYIKGITSKMRIKNGDKVYEIIGEPINVKSLNRELLCYCRLVK